MIPTISQGSSPATALKADIAANTNTVVINGVATQIKLVPVSPDNAQQVANWYNLTAAGPFVVWRTDISKDEVDKAVDWAEVVALTTNNLLSFQVLKDQSKLDGSNAGIRNAFNQIFPVATKPNSNAALLALAKRNATSAEKVFAAGTGSTASPATMAEEGAVTASEVLAALNS